MVSYSTHSHTPPFRLTNTADAHCMPPPSATRWTSTMSTALILLHSCLTRRHTAAFTPRSSYYHSRFPLRRYPATLSLPPHITTGRSNEHAVELVAHLAITVQHNPSQKSTQTQAHRASSPRARCLTPLPRRQ